MRRLILTLCVCSGIVLAAAAPAAAQTLTPASANFPATQVGKSSGPITFTLTAGLEPLATIVAITPSPTFSQKNNCPGTLILGQSCTINAFFSPETDNPRQQTGTLFAGMREATLSGTVASAPKKKCKKKGKKGAVAAKKKKCKKKKK